MAGYNGLAIAAAVSSGNPRNHKGSTIFGPGTITTTGFGTANTTNTLGAGASAYRPHTFGGAVPPNSATSSVSGVTSAGQYAQMVKGAYLMHGVGVTSNIAGVANTVLYSPGSDFGRSQSSIKKSSNDRSSFLYTYSWTADADGSPTYTATYSNHNHTWASGSTSTTAGDVAANPTAAVPGKLVYQNGANTPYQDAYKPRYLY